PRNAVCFLCQQTAEKYLKALQQELGIAVPRTTQALRPGSRGTDAEARQTFYRVAGPLQQFVRRLLVSPRRCSPGGPARPRLCQEESQADCRNRPRQTRS